MVRYLKYVDDGLFKDLRSHVTSEVEPSPRKEKILVMMYRGGGVVASLM